MNFRYQQVRPSLHSLESDIVVQNLPNLHCLVCLLSCMYSLQFEPVLVLC